MANLNEMTKEQLVEFINSGKSSQGRKDQVLACLKRGVDTIDAIAEELNINSKNVSSQLTYLRKDGHNILTVSAGGQSILLLISKEDLQAILDKRIK